MKTNLISKEGNEVKFSIVFSAEEFENAVVDAYKKNKDRFRIDGFRPGKAPRKIIENYYGEGVFWDEALNTLLQAEYPNALKELDLEVIDAPRIALDEMAKGSDVKVTATVEVFPEVEVKDYLGVEVEGVDYTVTDEEVENELKRVQKSQSRMETVTDRKTQDGDTVIIDFVGSVDGVPFDGGSAENFDLKLGSGQFIPGFEEQLVDKDAGEEVDVIVRFPDDYHADNLKGKDAVFKCKIHEIKSEILPEIDDDLASDVSEFETLEEYKADLRAKLQKDADASAVNLIKDSIISKVADANDIATPAPMVEDEADRMMNEMAQQLAYQGLSFDKYLEYMGQTADEMKASVMPEAARRVKTRILLRGIVNQEKLEATEEEIEDELKALGEQYGQSAEDVRKALGEESMKYFKQDVLTRKAIDLLYDKAVITAPQPKEEAPAEEEK
ncbi:MAG: trigger factor [Mogibacterium sp.]|nr:trigger factor [Mogibacterium sp.]